jgi:hypothetical protein
MEMNRRFMYRYRHRNGWCKKHIFQHSIQNTNLSLYFHLRHLRTINDIIIQCDFRFLLPHFNLEFRDRVNQRLLLELSVGKKKKKSKQKKMKEMGGL